MINFILFKVTLKIVVIVLLSLLTIMAVNSLLSPVYKFSAPSPFAGDLIYNPYADFDTTIVLKRANFHAHSWLPNGLTNGKVAVKDVINKYKGYGYDIIGLSNYQTITPTNPREEYQIQVYEHGYNIQKYHQLIFGKGTESFRDCTLPITTSACQSIISYFAARAEAVCINHPRFTLYFPVSRMKYLRGYNFIEADAGMSSALEWWDTGLSSGIPSFILSGDDSHNINNPHDIATHCVFINTISSKYTEVTRELKKGNFYSVRVPNFGDGDLDIKHIENNKLPRIKNVGFRNDSIFIKLSRAADSIKFIGQGGIMKLCMLNSDTAYYPIQSADTYIRTEIIFDNNVKIYTNPTFRTSSTKPLEHGTVPINLPLTILLNIVKVCISLFFIYLIVSIVRTLFRW